jgi:hypothetical protein
VRRRALAVGAAAVVAAASAAGAACERRAREIQSEAALEEAVRRMMPAVERATGLAFKRQPVVLRRTRAQVRDYVIHKFDDDLPPAELAGAQAAYRLFGLIPDTLDLRRTMIDLLTEQVAGYFDPDSDALYLPTDIDPGQARLVISHELVHALQDQYLNLDSLVELKRQNDRRTAAQAVLEGQATLAQILVLMPEQQVESLPDFWRLRTVLAQQARAMPAFANAPLWLRESLLFPYLGGAEFVRWFARQYPGKQPYGALMPVSTEQILHPARYAAGDRPVPLVFAAPADGAVRYEDGLGEFEIRLLLEQYLGGDSTVDTLAAGWNGDRYRVIATPEEGEGGAGAAGAAALVWYTLWDDRATADRFARALARAWARRRAGAPAGRRWEIARLAVETVAAVRLVDAPRRWAGWARPPAIRIGR